MTQFISDTVTPACQEVMDAIVAANSGVAESYGDDAWTLELQERFSEIFEKEVKVFPTVSGTASNALALATLTTSFGAIYCHEMAHINVDGLHHLHQLARQSQHLQHRTFEAADGLGGIPDRFDLAVGERPFAADVGSPVPPSPPGRPHGSHRCRRIGPGA
jgi:hypothetical protein